MSELICSRGRPISKSPVVSEGASSGSQAVLTEDSGSIVLALALALITNL